MSEQRYCDICSRPEVDLTAEAPDGSPVLEIDADGLLGCYACRTKLTLPPTIETAAELPETLHKLVGENAGAICRTLNLPYTSPYRTIIDAVATIAYDGDRYMSTWTYATQWPDGTTVWRAQDAQSIAIVTPDGAIRIQPA